jgi:predicted ArsR family transcriptional regulator
VDGVTESELLRALQAALSAAPEGATGAMTTRELCEALDLYPEKVRRGLRALSAQGRLEIVRVKRQGLDGRMSYRPAYRLREVKENDDVT